MHPNPTRLALTAGGVLFVLFTGCSNTQYSVVRNSAAFDGYGANHSALNQVPHKFRSSTIQGYQAGLADGAKNDYWALQRIQEGDGPGETTVIDVDIPATVTEDGRQLTPRRLQVPLVQ
jgi:hypothetical protein